MKKKFFVFLGMSIILALLFAGCTSEVDGNLVVGTSITAATYPSLVVADIPDANILVRTWSSTSGLADPVNKFEATQYVKADPANPGKYTATGCVGDQIGPGVITAAGTLPDAVRAAFIAAFPFPKTARSDLKLDPYAFYDVAGNDLGETPTFTPHYVDADGYAVVQADIKPGDTVYIYWTADWSGYNYQIPVWDKKTGAQQTYTAATAPVPADVGKLVYDTSSVAAEGKSKPSKKLALKIVQGTAGTHYTP